MKITFYGTRDYDHLYFDVLAADPEYGCSIRFLAANLDKDTAPLAAGGEAVCAFVNADGSAPVLETLAAVGVKLLLLRCAGFNNVGAGLQPRSCCRARHGAGDGCQPPHLQSLHQGTQQ